MIKTSQRIANASRIVVKVGSSSITGQNDANLDLLVDFLVRLKESGKEVILVSSGAIASALPFFGLEARPKDDLVTEQAAAAVGQTILMDRYRDALRPHNIVGAQILLTASDFENESTRDNASAALSKLLQLRFLPIVNENDTVATHEIRFGDNDRLAALVAALVRADALVLLSDVDALYSRPPGDAGAEKIEFVTHEDDLAGIVIGGNGSRVGTGGAETKVQAARFATSHGIPVILTSAALVSPALEGEEVGTLFEAAPTIRDLD